MNIAICDDDNEARGYYSQLVSLIARKNGLDVRITTFADGEQLLFALEDSDSAFDIVLLDVMMPKVDGIAVGRRLHELEFPGVLVYLSSSKEYALQAFDVHAFNYVIKRDHHDIDRFKKTFLAAVDAVEGRHRRFILINGIDDHRNIPIDSILYFEVMKHVCVVHYVPAGSPVSKSRAMEFLSTLDRLENMLMSYGFMRTHRSYLVNCAYVEGYTYNSVSLADGTTVPLGRQRQAAFKEAMEERVIVNVAGDKPSREGDDPSDEGVAKTSVSDDGQA
ncbi:MAG: LytTR family DNA-binding domain-containing protein [Atopobiaceae bacterium]|nr:LytTR family DNA-binding domain-containing protein [Atopobiaceae bacterium]MCI2173771.1 LytTR family DNA-binding domain-containing protein [Atopobiaceae bacterium]